MVRGIKKNTDLVGSEHEEGDEDLRWIDAVEVVEVIVPEVDPEYLASTWLWGPHVVVAG